MASGSISGCTAGWGPVGGARKGIGLAVASAFDAEGCSIRMVARGANASLSAWAKALGAAAPKTWRARRWRQTPAMLTDIQAVLPFGRVARPEELPSTTGT